MPTVLRSRAWLPLVALSVIAGCGGRTADDGFRVANDAGLGGSYAGSVGYAGGSFGGGASLGGNPGSFGGTIGAGDAPGCQLPVPCPSGGPCAPGQQSVTLPGQCCATCQACPPIFCPLPSCGPGQTLATPPGECCPVCTGTDPCANVRCEGPMCPAGSTFVTPPGQCCPVCNPPGPCAGAGCGPLACIPGWEAVIAPGECCPSCAPMAVDASVGPCDQVGYAQFLQKEIIGLDALSCTSPNDCMAVSLPNACSSGCDIVLNAKSSAVVSAQMNQFASMSCSGCPPVAGGNCPPYVPTCVNGQCEGVLPL